jgi:hypothetical protein
VSAKYQVIQKRKATIKKDEPFTDEFPLPGLKHAPRGSVILMFQVSGKAGSVTGPDAWKGTLKITTDKMLVHEVVPTVELNDTFTKPRAWVEALADTDFADTGNKIAMTLHNPANEQEIYISDVVILYHD